MKLPTQAHATLPNKIVLMVLFHQSVQVVAIEESDAREYAQRQTRQELIGNLHAATIPQAQVVWLVLMKSFTSHLVLHLVTAAPKRELRSHLHPPRTILKGWHEPKHIDIQTKGIVLPSRIALELAHIPGVYHTRQPVSHADTRRAKGFGR